MTAGLSARVVVRRSLFSVDVEVRVAAGETVAVMGPSGAGKSTLLGAIAGLVPLDDGEVTVDGRLVERAAAGGRVAHETRGIGRGAGLAAEKARASPESPRAGRVRLDPMHRGVVLLGQDARLFPHLTARENVAFGPRSAGVARTEARREAEAWLERVGVAGLGDRRPAALSGGEQQRVAVARALAASPRAVLLDEPLVALDPATASDIRSMLRTQLAGVTTLAVTHDALDAVALADRLVVIEAGTVTQSGVVRDVLERPRSAFVAAVAGTNRLLGRGDRGGWDGGFRLESADADSQAAARDGAAVAAVFRPGNVRVGEPQPGCPHWSARITGLEPTLGGMRVRTDRGDADVALTAPAPAVGDRVTLSVAPSAVRFVPAS